MKTKPLFLFSALVCFSISLIMVPPVFSQDSQQMPDAVVKIAKVGQLLQKLDQIAEAMPDANQASPAMLANSFLQGTDWIDPDRSIVIGAFLKSEPTEKPDVAALFPFRHPSNDFENIYSPVIGGDYYIIRLPRQSGGIVSDRMEHALVACSRRPHEGLITLDVPLSQLIDKAEPQIQEKLDAVEEAMPETQGPDFSPAQTKEMLSNFIDTGRQIKRLRLGLDLTDTDVAFFLNALALPEVNLGALFDGSQFEKELILAGYQSAYQINFQSRPYDMTAVMHFIDLHFGTFYDQLGVDFGELTEIMKYFTGEMAGGISFGENGPVLEMIQIIDASENLPDDYLESVYLPWILDYGKTMADFYNAQFPDIQMDPLTEKTSPSTVAGRPVIGVQCKMPNIADVSGKTEMKSFDFEMRMLRLESMILTASDDERLEKLLQKAGNLEKTAAKGPVLQADIDMSAYLKGLMEFMPDPIFKPSVEVPEMGKLIYILDVVDNTLKTRYSMKIDDIKKLAAYFSALPMEAQQGEKEAQQGEKQFAPSSPQPEPAPESQEEDEAASPSVEQTSTQTEMPDKDSPQYWLQKGGLFATYGNTKRAVEHFKKAAQLDPENSKAYFHLGVSYGEAGKIPKALDAINRAISLKPEAGNYYYARGWIYLLDDQRDLATIDMRRAAELGSQDAVDYLESIQKRD